MNAMIKFLRLLVLAVSLAAWLRVHAQQAADDNKNIKAYLNAPFVLNVQVRVSREKEDPVRASLIYRKMREIPNVNVVREHPDMLLDVVGGQSGSAYIFQLVVLRPANAAFRDIIADHVEIKLREQGVAQWKQAGSLIREEATKLERAFFYDGVLMHAGSDASAVIDTTIKAFEVGYVEPKRVEDKEFKERLRAVIKRLDEAKTPEEERAAASELGKLLGLPPPKTN